jgi:hypothetical protein
MAQLVFTSSESFLDFDPNAVERHVIEIDDYIEATYCELRSGPYGDTHAVFQNDAWTIVTTGQRASDWAVGVY